MKAAVAIAGEHAKNSAFVVWRGFAESIYKASEYGYDGVELALKAADDIDRTSLRKWLSAYHMEVSCITTGQVFSDSGLYFTHESSEKRKKVIEIFSDFIDLAEEFGGMVNVGRVRGFISSDSKKEEEEKRFIDTIQKICDIGEKKRVQIIVEPVNRYETNFINNLDQGADALEKIGRKNCGLHADVFHMNIEDDQLGESIIRNGKWIRYIHFADSNRLAPGMGHLDFNEVMEALKKIRYDGWISMEILPENDPDWMAGKAINFIRPKIVDLMLK